MHKTFGVMQPYFLPYIGYFQLMNAVDEYVIADDCNYMNKSYINRNKILIQGAAIWFHLRLQSKSIHKWINELYVANDQGDLLKTIDMAYHKAPHFNTIFPMMEQIITFEDKNLARYIGNSLIKIADYLQMKANFRYESDDERCDRTLMREERLISDLVLWKADTYLNAIGGTALYDKATFKAAGIDLRFVKTLPIKYKQFGNSFVPNLSILDVLMFNPIEKIKVMLNQFVLV